MSNKKDLQPPTPVPQDLNSQDEQDSLESTKEQKELNPSPPKHSLKRLLEVFSVSTKLGLTSFGGPIAHLGFFHHEYVQRRKWLDERSYADLVALSHFLPGPSSSQVGIGIGIMRAGLWGGLASFIGFTMPSIIILVIFALLVQGFDLQQTTWLHGLKIVAVAIVAQAVIGMAQKLIPDRNRQIIAILAVIFILVWPTSFIQIGVIILAGIAGFLLYRKQDSTQVSTVHIPIPRSLGFVCLGLFFTLLITLPILSGGTSSSWLALFDSFYRAGALVFGGGHVVLPLLEKEVVATGWINSEVFLAGYGATQAVPGPLFTFASYLGAMINGWLGALVATIAIFLPGFLLIVGALPFWSSLRQNQHIQGILFGVNAAVVGILIAALYDPIWIHAILSPLDFALAALLFSMLVLWKLPPWLVVLTGATGGLLLSFL